MTKTPSENLPPVPAQARPRRVSPLLGGGQRRNLVMTQVVDEAVRLRERAGDAIANDYLLLNGVPTTVIARVLSQSIRKRPAAHAAP